MLEQEGYDLMAAAFEVYNQIGPGFLEEVYQECFELELAERQIPFSSQPNLELYYKDRLLKKYYVADLIAYDSIIVELKAVKELTSEHLAQLMNYLKATRKPVGYLVNFGSAHKLEWKRIIL